MKSGRLWPVLCLLVCVSGSAFGKSTPEPFAWPTLPDEAARKAASALQNDGGLVILERQTKIYIGSLKSGSGRVGARTEDFLRFLVVREEGIQSASLPLELGSGCTLERIEGRSVAPDGAVTPLDGEKDVERVVLSRLGDKESLYTQATARFPNPQVGSVLDLHYVSFQPGPYSSHIQPLLFNLTTTVRGETELTFDNDRWTVLTVGDSKGAVKLEKPQNSEYRLHLSPYEIEAREKEAPPGLHTSPTLVCFLNYFGVNIKPRNKSEAPKVSTSSVTIDGRGRAQGLSFPAGAEVTDWWVEFLKKNRKGNLEFIERSSKVESVDVEGCAPESLPLEERLARLYRLTQATVRRNPFANLILTINNMMSRGSDSDWQGTLLFAHFLDRAKIPYLFGLVADREALRFSPVIRSGLAYGLATAVVVPRPGKTPLVLMPGDFSLDYGVLPYSRQDAMVFWLEGEETVRTCYSDVDTPDADSALFGYALEMDAAGGARGSVTLTERGAKCRAFRRWYVLRELEATSPERNLQKDPTEAERTEQLDREVKAWFWSPGDQVTFSACELVKCVQSAQEPTEFRAQAQVKGVGQASGERMLVLANPLMCGFSDPFVRPSRRYPIWNKSGGRRVVEGELLLPVGAKVLELPKSQELRGPEGWLARYTVEAVEREGRVALKSRFEYVVPLIVENRLYGAYRLYLDGIVKMAQEKCIVQFSGEKELE